jgi:hypothetical protein
MPVSSRESEWIDICVLWISILQLSTGLFWGVLDLGTVPTVCFYFISFSLLKPNICQQEKKYF